MATYAELRTASELPALLIQVQVACIVAANTISLEVDTTPLHSQRLKWASLAYGDPVATARKMIWAVLAANKSSTPAQIAGATDAVVQTAVDANVNTFAATMV